MKCTYPCVLMKTVLPLSAAVILIAHTLSSRYNVHIQQNILANLKCLAPIWRQHANDTYHFCATPLLGSSAPADTRDVYKHTQDNTMIYFHAPQPRTYSSGHSKHYTLRHKCFRFSAIYFSSLLPRSPQPISQLQRQHYIIQVCHLLRALISLVPLQQREKDWKAPCNKSLQSLTIIFSAVQAEVIVCCTVIRGNCSIVIYGSWSRIVQFLQRFHLRMQHRSKLPANHGSDQRK